MPKISVIVPVYNAEKFLSECIKSVLNQTYKDFELLLINDGSTDNSANICKSFAENDSRIILFNKSNEGVSKTRQFGINKSKGEYIIFIDSDDKVDTNMLYCMLNKIVESASDMVICDYWAYENNKDKYICQNPISCNNKSLLNSFLSQKLHGSCCNKMVRKEFYLKVTFPLNLNYSEDTYVIMHIVNLGAKVVYLNSAFYHYRLTGNENSIMKSNKIKLLEQGLEFVRLIKDICPINEFKDGYAVQYADLAVRAYCSHYFDSKKLRETLVIWDQSYGFVSKLPRLWKFLITLLIRNNIYEPFYFLIRLRRILLK